MSTLQFVLVELDGASDGSSKSKDLKRIVDESSDLNFEASSNDVQRSIINEAPNKVNSSIEEIQTDKFGILTDRNYDTQASEIRATVQRLRRDQREHKAPYDLIKVDSSDNNNVRTATSFVAGSPEEQNSINIEGGSQNEDIGNQDPPGSFTNATDHSLHQEPKWPSIAEAAALGAVTGLMIGNDASPSSDDPIDQSGQHTENTRRSFDVPELGSPVASDDDRAETERKISYDSPENHPDTFESLMNSDLDESNDTPEGEIAKNQEEKDVSEPRSSSAQIEGESREPMNVNADEQQALAALNAGIPSVPDTNLASEGDDLNTAAGHHYKKKKKKKYYKVKKVKKIKIKKKKKVKKIKIVKYKKKKKKKKHHKKHHYDHGKYYM